MSPERRIDIYKGEKIGRQRFARSPIEGTQSDVLLEPKSEVIMSRRNIRRALSAARGLATSRSRVDLWLGRYKKNSQELVDLGETHEGFRGIGNVGAAGEDAALIPTRKNLKFDEDLIRKNLKPEEFDRYFEETIQVSIVPTKEVSEDSVRKTLSRKLSRLGIHKKDQEGKLNVETVLKPRDNQALLRAIESGKLKLPIGAVSYEISLDVKLLPQKREELPAQREEK